MIARRFAGHALLALAAATALALLSSLLPFSDQPDYPRAFGIGGGLAAIAALFAHRLGQGNSRLLGPVFGMYWMGIGLLDAAAFVGFHLWWCGTVINVGIEAVGNAAAQAGGNAPASAGPHDYSLPVYIPVALVWSFFALVLGLVKGVRWNLPGGARGAAGALLSAFLAIGCGIAVGWVGGSIGIEAVQAFGEGLGPEGLAFGGFGATIGALVGHQIGYGRRVLGRAAGPGVAPSTAPEPA